MKGPTFVLHKLEFQNKMNNFVAPEDCPGNIAEHSRSDTVVPFL